ncbi:transglycosylase domain-containing protein [Sanguibacter antarcticus]|uniref:Membrane peptidoglycan carboxypeptidase n=1 Tax=Sanguibacter antarcticus TaxID=372484 RepID=A0A2A9E7T7_9MICO|nr:transglycosylase domain-containing protein [Sanguibacter antarcticus]PFG34716.1 membrane peptidoglycan carboxypeptidase [Sanguibacter antarcticus]
MASSSNRPARSTGSGAQSRTPSTRRTASSTGRSTGRPTARTSGRPTGRTSGRTTSKRKFFDYPRSGKGPIHRWLPSWRVVVGTGLTVIALVVGLVLAAYASITVPKSADEFALAQASKVYYADGVTEMATYADQNREIIESEEIPEHVKQAVVASEDGSFYENSGIDPMGMARALIGNLKGGRVTGGSTITQQYVERYYKGSTTSDYAGKVEEVLMAVKIDRQQDKDQILTGYLNTIYFGRGANGIQTAALLYFGVPASELTVAQAALIAGVIPNPTGWDPRNDPEKAESRWEYVVGRMVEKGFLTQAERDALVYPEAVPFVQENKLAGPKGYLLDMVTRELDSDAAIDEEDLLTGGLTIVTTIDKGIQDQAEQAIANMATDSSPNLVKTIVTIDPATGGYLALYAGADYTTTQFNGATQGTAQAGSTFKPFALMAGLEAGKTLYDTFDGNSPKSFGEYEVANFAYKDYGVVTLEKATAESINTAYIELNEEIGPENTVDVAVRAGVPADGLESNLANVLGTATVRPVDMASAYATFAAQGVRHEAHILASVSRGGAVTYTPPNTPQQEFQAPDVAELTYALTKVVEEGSGKAASALGVPIAGKTGTSQDNKSAWFVGYTPQFVTAVTLYQSGEGGVQETITPFGGVSAENGVTGGTIPVQVWTDYMGMVLEGREVVQFPARTKVTKPTYAPTQEPTYEPTEEATTEAPEDETATVPNGLVGRSRNNAESAVRAAGLNSSITEAYDSDVKKGNVISVVPGEGSETAIGSTVSIVVSKGPDQSSIPTQEPTEEPEPEPEPEPTATATTKPTTTPAPEPTATSEEVPEVTTPKSSG